jgi:hypothetical protein
MTATIAYDVATLFSTPGGVRYVQFLYSGEQVEILQGWKYEDRPWKDKRFIKVQAKSGKIGYINAYALKDSKSKWNGGHFIEETDDGQEESSIKESSSIF